MQSSRIELSVARAARKGHLHKLREAFTSKGYQNPERANAASKKNGNTALLLAMKYGHELLVSPMLDNPHVDINFRNKHGKDALTLCKDENLLKLLLNDKRLKITDKLHERYHIFMFWLRRHNLDAVSALLEHEAFVEVVNGINGLDSPETPLAFTIDYEMHRMALLLMAKPSTYIAGDNFLHAVRLERFDTALCMVWRPDIDVLYMDPKLKMTALDALIFKMGQEKDESVKAPDSIYIELIKRILCHPGMTEQAVQAACGLGQMFREIGRERFNLVMQEPTTLLSLTADKKSLAVTPDNMHFIQVMRGEVNVDWGKFIGYTKTAVEMIQESQAARQHLPVFSEQPVPQPSAQPASHYAKPPAPQPASYKAASAPPQVKLFGLAPLPPSVQPSAPPMERPIPPPRK